MDSSWREHVPASKNILRQVILKQVIGDIESSRQDSAAHPVYSFPQDAPLTPTVKSYGISLILHASVVAALYVIPESKTQRFSQIGDTLIISIEAAQESPPSNSAVYVATQPLPLTSERESPISPVVKTEPIEPREFADALSEPERSDSPKLSLPASIPDLPVDLQVMMKRQIANEIVRVVSSNTTPRPKTSRPVNAPTPPAAPPIKQHVGLEKETSADLSNNSPPSYPLEAVRQRLEGVVFLRLKITKQGKVANVELIKSSGHQILDTAAINAVAKWHGQPAKKWGLPVTSTERLPVRFRL